MSLIAVTVAATVCLVAWTASAMMRAAFGRFNAQQTAALVAQFQREFRQRGVEVTHQVEGISNSKDTQRIAYEITRSAPDYAAFVNEAAGLAPTHQLDFLEILAEDGTIVSSAQWPARFGYKEKWITETADWSTGEAFLKQEDLPDGAALALLVVRPVHIGEKTIYFAGGKKLDSGFLASLTLPAGMRALLYRGNDSAGGMLEGAEGSIPNFEPLLPLISRVRANPVEQAQTVAWAKDTTNSEIFHAFPLLGQHREILGMLLVGSSLREQMELQRQIRWLALLTGTAGILIGMILSVWAAARVTKPIELLAAAAEEVAQGRWSIHVPVSSKDEIGKLGESFNRMTEQLTEQRERLVQAERVAAWRELARRLAHELKNPLFPLQITVENLLRARQGGEDQFEEVFRESTATLLAELGNLRAIVGRFSDFAKMPLPQLEPVNLNEIVTAAMRVFDAQLSAPGKPAIEKRLKLDSHLDTIQADPDLLQRAVQNLILNAIDAMPAGGTLTIRSESAENGVKLDVSDTGTGLTHEECERLFTPYYTTKQHGTGLGLAIVQSVVSDHQGRIAVESEPGKGTTFRIFLPRQVAMPSLNKLGEEGVGAGARTSSL